VSRTGQPYTAARLEDDDVQDRARGDRRPGNALEEPFSFHDFRARSATDEEEIYGTSPQHRLGHKRRSTTEIYMRGKSRSA
jgi:integrase